MKFKEIKEALVRADRDAIADWNERENDWMREPPSIEARLSFVEHRRSMLAGAIMAILTELIAREEA